MGEHGFDAASGLRAARIALPCAAVSLPAAILLGSLTLEVTSILCFVVGATMLYVGRGERPIDAFGAMAAAAALVCVPSVPTDLMMVMACVYSLSMAFAFLIAGREQRSRFESNKAVRPNAGVDDGIAAV